MVSKSNSIHFLKILNWNMLKINYHNNSKKNLVVLLEPVFFLTVFLRVGCA